MAARVLGVDRNYNRGVTGPFLLAICCTIRILTERDSLLLFLLVGV